MHLRSHSHRRQVIGAVKGGAHTKGFAEMRQLSGRGKPSDIAYMNAYKINPLILYDSFPLSEAGEKFSHCQWYRGLFPDYFKVTGLFRRKGIFKEEQFLSLIHI